MSYFPVFENGLIDFHSITPAEVFREKGSVEIIEAIEKEAFNFSPDVSTDKGRKQIASKAYSVAQSKTFLDNAGKEFVADKKAEIKSVDVERKSIRDQLDEIKKRVRSPLTKFENEQAEIARKQAEERERLEREEAEKIENERIEKIKAEQLAREEKQRAIDEENARIKAEQEQAQAEIDKANAELKKRQDEAEQVEREKQFAIDEKNRLAFEEIERQKAEVQAEKNRIAQAEIERLAKAEYDRLTENKRLEDIEKAKEKAIDDERERVAEEKRYYEEKEAEIKRIEIEAKSKQDHIDKIDDEAHSSLCACLSFDGDKAKEVLNWIKAGNINNVSINY